MQKWRSTSRQENLLQIHTTKHRHFRFDVQDRTMVYDFHQICKTYDKDIYDREYFKATPCPGCKAIGKFNMHGSYSRHVIFFDDNKTKHKRIEIKRIKCISCKRTHAVMPGDIIPYKMLSLFVLIFILVLVYLEKVPILKIENEWGFSFQFIYSVIRSFQLYMNNIRQYFREIAFEDIPAVFDAYETIALIKKPYIKFQFGYMKTNIRPCFMCKFFNGKGAPPIGLIAPPGGNNITFE